MRWIHRPVPPGNRMAPGRVESVEAEAAAPGCCSRGLPREHGEGGNVSLSEDLNRLSVRAKEAEDRVAAAKTDAREKLEQARSNARTDAQQTADQLQATSSAAAAQVKQ